MTKRILAAALAAPAVLLGCSLSLPENARLRGAAGREAESPLPKAGTVASIKAGEPLFGVLFDISDPSLPPGEKAGGVQVDKLLLSLGADGSLSAGEERFLYRASSEGGEDDDDGEKIVDLGWQAAWSDKTAEWITRSDPRVGNFGALLSPKGSPLVWENRAKAGTTLGDAWAITLRFDNAEVRAAYFKKHLSQLVDGVVCVITVEAKVFDDTQKDGEKWQTVHRDAVCQYRYKAWTPIVWRYGDTF